MIRVGVIGLGFMGRVHLSAWQGLEQADVVAVCTTTPGIPKAAEGNIDTGSGDLNLEGVQLYTDIATMLNETDLHAVSIALPSHLHKEVSIQCLNAGLHVLCEKPMALTADDCDAMIEASVVSGREFMVAHCIRFWPAYAWLKEAADQQRFGPVLTASFERLTYAPAWSESSWFSDPEKSGGIALDLHIHDLDFIQHLLGEPDQVQSHTIRLANGTPGHIHSLLRYGDDRVVTAVASWMMPRSFGFRMSYHVTFEQASLVFDGGTLRVYPAEGEPYEPDLPSNTGYELEIEHFASRILDPESPVRITPEQAASSVRMALETLS